MAVGDSDIRFFIDSTFADFQRECANILIEFVECEVPISDSP